MYIIVPIVIMAAAAVMVTVIVGRKFPYLKKLPVETTAVANISIWEEFFPELFHFFKKIDLSFYQSLFFKELEKFLRRLRIVSLKLDHFTKRLIDKIKTSGQTKKTAENQSPKSEFQAPALLSSHSELSLEEKQKQTEHALIIEIAKNPKNAELYKKLADLYILMENFQDAIGVLETAVKLDPSDRKIAAKLRAVQKVLPSKPA